MNLIPRLNEYEPRLVISFKCADKESGFVTDLVF